MKNHLGRDVIPRRRQSASGKRASDPRGSWTRVPRTCKSGLLLNPFARRTRYNSVILQLFAAVVCGHIVRSALCSSSQLQSSGDETDIVIARSMYILRQHCRQYVASPSSFPARGISAPPPSVIGLTGLEMEQPGQVRVTGRVSIKGNGVTSVA